MVNVLKALNVYNCTGERIAIDESLASHDAKFHPNGFDPEEDTCIKRDRMAKYDDPVDLSGKDKMDFGDRVLSAHIKKVNKWGVTNSADDAKTKLLNRIRAAGFKGDVISRCTVREKNAQDGKNYYVVTAFCGNFDTLQKLGNGLGNDVRFGLKNEGRVSVK